MILKEFLARNWILKINLVFLQLCLSVTPDRQASHLVRAENIVLRPPVHLFQRPFKPSQVNDGVVVDLHDELCVRTALGARPDEPQHHLVGGHLVAFGQGTLNKEGLFHTKGVR